MGDIFNLITATSSRVTEAAIRAQGLESSINSFQTQLVSLASTGSSVPLSSNEADIAAVRGTLEYLVVAGKEVIIIAHSYAGVPTCEAAKGLAKQKGNEAGRVRRYNQLGFCSIVVVAG